MTAVVRQLRSLDLFDLLDQVPPMITVRTLTDPYPIRVEDRIEDGHYLIRAELPGFDPDNDVTVTVADNRLIIDAERTEEWSEKTRSEFHYGTFRRAMALPAGSKEDDIKATYADGVLTVAIGLAAEPPLAKAKDIRPRGSVAPTNGFAVGPTLFAAVVMMVVGVLEAIQGVVALFNDTFYAAGKKWLFSFDITTWGWVHLVMGIVVAVVGIFVLQGAGWARTVGVAVAALSAVLNFAWLPYYPAWSMLIIALDVFVIWALIAHGRRGRLVMHRGRKSTTAGHAFGEEPEPAGKDEPRSDQAGDHRGQPDRAFAPDEHVANR